MPALGLALALIVGLALGMLGGGGAILTVPIFTYVLGYDPKPSIAMSLAIVGTISLAGVLTHWRAGRVDFRTAVLFGVVAMAGSFVGARLAVFVSGATQLVLFALVMLVAAGFMIRDGPAAGAVDDRAAIAALMLAPIGFGVGVLTGLVGVGGGFLIVPALVLLARLPVKRAIGTSLLVIAMNTFAGFLGYLGHVRVEWGVMAAFAGLAIVGIVVGSWLVRYVPQHALKRAFAILLVVMGTLILFQNRSVLRDAFAGAPDSPADAASPAL